MENPEFSKGSVAHKLVTAIQGLEAQKALITEEIERLKHFPESSNLLENKTKKLAEIEKDLASLQNDLRLHTPSERTWMTSSGRLEKAPLYYADYIRLDTLLSCQQPESVKYGKPAHDEMLFIIIHQVYELWFKQILHEMNAVILLLNRDYVPERDISRMVHHLARIVEIQKVLVDQFNILETMTSLDFMDFRDFLFPASGFQSFQFRLVENKLGMQSDKRVQYERKSYHTKLSTEHQKQVQEAENGPSLFQAIEKWLERTPFLKDQSHNYDFLEDYKKAAEKMFDEDKQVILKNTEKSSSQERDQDLKKLEDNRSSFKALFDEEAHNEKIKAGSKRLSFRATQAALLIYIYQDEPIFNLPYRLLQCLVDIDEYFTSWRYKHSLMVQRMIGTKLGTGGSSGYWYLKSTIEKGRVFADISNLPTYLLPRKDTPVLPSFLRKAMGFYAEQKEEQKV